MRNEGGGDISHCSTSIPVLVFLRNPRLEPQLELSPVALAIESNGKFLFVANSGSDDISVYSIDDTTGALTPIAGSPFPTGAKPLALTASSNGFLYVANSNAGSVSAYSISSSSGQLTEISGSPYPVGTDPYSVAADPGGHFLYVANAGIRDQFLAFTIDSSSSGPLHFDHKLLGRYQSNLGCGRHVWQVRLRSQLRVEQCFGLFYQFEQRQPRANFRFAIRRGQHASVCRCRYLRPVSLCRRPGLQNLWIFDQCKHGRADCYLRIPLFAELDAGVDVHDAVALCSSSQCLKTIVIQQLTIARARSPSKRDPLSCLENSMMFQNAIDEQRGSKSRSRGNLAIVPKKQLDVKPQVAQKAKRWAINLFIGFHVLAIACWCLPIDTPLLPLCRSFVRSYFLWAGLFQSWDMFAPVPKGANTYIEAELHYRDGSRKMWTLPTGWRTMGPNGEALQRTLPQVC